MPGTAIAIAAGSLLNVFSHGVVTAFEQGGFAADAYAGVSSATLPAAVAAARQATQVGVEHWRAAAAAITESGLSGAVAGSIARYAEPVRHAVSAPGAPRLLIGTSQVITPSVIRAITRRPGAYGAGLLIGDPGRNAAWARRHLTPTVWDSAPARAGHRALTAANLDRVAEASTRMLVTGERPAVLGEQTHIDGCYTRTLPLREALACGHERVIAISPHRRTYLDLYRTQPVIPTDQAHTVVWERLPALDLAVHVTPDGTQLHVLAPPRSLRYLGVEFHTATPEGLERAYRMGQQAGEAYLAYLEHHDTLTAAATRRVD